MKAEINIPEGLHEITLGQYQEFVIKSDGLEGDELMRCVVEVFCSLPKVTVMKIRYIDVKTIANTINEYFNTDPDFSGNGIAVWINEKKAKESLKEVIPVQKF